MSNKIVKRVAADIGGAFTDITVTEDGDLLTWKLPSTPPNFADAVSKGIALYLENILLSYRILMRFCMVRLLPMQSWNRKVPRQP